MTSELDVEVLAGPVDRAPSPIPTLARLEARRALTGAPLWIGVLFTALYLWTNTKGPDWQAGSYSLVLSAAFGPMAAGVFVVGVRAGGRDRSTVLPPLAEESPLDQNARAVARLAAVLAPTAVAAVIVAIVVVVSRVEGGYWMGDFPGRVDDAVHSFPEALQPVLAVAVAGVAGVAAGRATRRRAPIAVVGCIVCFLASAAYWVWQVTPVRYVTLLQIQPVDVALPAGTGPGDVPESWLLSAPGEFQQHWRRVVVDLGMVNGHDLFLAGLIILGAGLALRGGTARRIVVAGVAVAVAGVIVQVLSAPSALYSGG